MVNNRKKDSKIRKTKKMMENQRKGKSNKNRQRKKTVNNQIRKPKKAVKKQRKPKRKRERRKRNRTKTNKQHTIEWLAANNRKNLPKMVRPRNDRRVKSFVWELLLLSCYKGDIPLAHHPYQFPLGFGMACFHAFVRSFPVAGSLRFARSLGRFFMCFYVFRWFLGSFLIFIGFHYFLFFFLSLVFIVSF